VSDRDDDRDDRPRRSPSSGGSTGSGSGRDGGRRDSRGPAQGSPDGQRGSADRRSSSGPRQGDRPQRSDRPSGDRPQRSDRPSYGDRPQRSDRPSGDRPQRSDRPSYGDRPQRSDRPGGGDRRGAPGRGAAAGGRGGGRDSFNSRDRQTPEERDPYGLKSVRPAQEVAHVPDDVEPRDLDKVARGELKTLSKENADWVAKHLVMAGRLIEEDPEEAHKHALSAGRRAGRIGVVRETIAITAYTVGDYAMALRELRTYRRISGRDDHLPLMVDSERGLERPERALELGRSVDVATLDVPVRVQLAIAMSGARLDLGQPDAALRELEIPQLDRRKAFSYSPELFDAYATVLDDLGRESEGDEWRALSERASAALDALAGGDDLETIEIVEEELEVDLDEEWIDVEGVTADVATGYEASEAAVAPAEDEPTTDDFVESGADDEDAADEDPAGDQGGDEHGDDEHGDDEQIRDEQAHDDQPLDEQADDERAADRG